MKPGWKEVRLGEMLDRYLDDVLIDDFQKYKRITIRIKGAGIELRDEAAGVEIGTKRQFRVRKNQFLMSKIDAMNGAFGIIPESCDQAIITGNFWSYNYDSSLIGRNFLDYLCLKGVFTAFSLAASSGTTNRKYLDERKFLNLTIYLPPLAEQQRIVAKLDVVKTKLAEVERLRAQQDKDVKALLFAHYTRLIENAEWLPMREVAPITRRSVEIDPDQSYPELGIRSFGKGTFHKPPMKGSELTWQKPVWLKSGDLVFSNIKAWEGAVAIVQPDDDGRVGSHRYISCVPDPDVTSADFLFYYFQTPEGNEKLNTASPGSADRNRTLNTKKLADTLVPIPPLASQAEFLVLRSKLAQMQQLHAQSAVQLEQLMPSLLAQAFGE